MTYYINNECVARDVFCDTLQDKIREYIEDTFDSIVDAKYGKIVIGDITYMASEIMFNCNPTGYDENKIMQTENDYADAMINLNNGLEEHFGGLTFNIKGENDHEN